MAHPGKLPGDAGTDRYRFCLGRSRDLPLSFCLDRSRNVPLSLGRSRNVRLSGVRTQRGVSLRSNK